MRRRMIKREVLNSPFHGPLLSPCGSEGVQVTICNLTNKSQHRIIPKDEKGISPSRPLYFRPPPASLDLCETTWRGQLVGIQSHRLTAGAIHDSG
jgi:hypothetical protein